MRRTAAEKYEVIRLVEGSDLPVRQTLRELQVNRSTFYVWYGSGLASELRAQGDFLSVAACEVRPEARKPVTHVHGP